MPLNEIPALFGSCACCWKTAYAHGCMCTYGRCMPSAVTFGGCLTGKYSMATASVNCTLCEAGGQRAAVVNSIVRLTQF